MKFRSHHDAARTGTGEQAHHHCGRFAGAGDSGFGAPAGYTMPAMASASSRSRQSRIATTRPSRTVNTS
jgi:hypothetical protein